MPRTLLARRCATALAASLGGLVVAVAPARAVGTYTVADSGANSISVFADLPGGAPRAPTAAIVGAATGLNRPMQIAKGPNGVIYAANQGANSITEYAANATGNAAPLRTIAGAATGLSSPQGVAVDRAGRIYVANAGANTITVYAAAAAGNVAPTSVISGTATRLAKPVSVAVDGAGALFVANQTGNSVTEYAPGASGNAPPTLMITTGIATPSAVSITSGDDVVVANTNPSDFTLYSAPRGLIAGTVTPAGITTPGGVSLYSSGSLMATGTASGNVGIFGPASGVVGSNSGPTSGLVHPTGLLVNGPLTLGAPAVPAPQLVVGKAFSERTLAFGGQPPYVWSIASGTLPPGLALNTTTGEISGTPTAPVTSSTVVLRITDAATPAVSATNTRTYAVAPAIQPSLYVSNGGNSRVAAFALATPGNVAPWTTFTSANGIDAGSALAFDALGDLYVADYGSGKVTEYAPGAAGPPIATAAGLSTPSGVAASSGQTPQVMVSQQAASTLSVYLANPVSGVLGAHVADITGPDTGLSAPAGVVWAGGLWWVANEGNDTVTAYSATAAGDARPVRTLAGFATGLNHPHGIATDAAGDILVTNRFGPSVTVYRGSADGNAAPLRTITSSALSGPTGIDLDEAGDIFVANGFRSDVVVFSPTASGPSTPFETFAGATTGILGPEAVAITPPYAILTRRLPAVRVGHRYRVRLRVAEGTSPYRWSLRSGHLPAGLRLSAAGVVSGRPTAAGRAVFTVAVRDSSQPHETLVQRLAIRVTA